MITIISPHLDDAVLSLGGTIALLRSRGTPVVVKNIFTISSWTNADSISNIQYESNVDVVTALREQEEDKASKVLGFQYELMKYVDLPLRPETSKTAVFHEVKNKLQESLNEDHIYFFPLGLQHPDHLGVAQIGRELLEEGYQVLLYEDLPYAAFGNYDYKDRYRSLIKSGLVPTNVNIDPQPKMSAMQEYSSQISMQWLRGVMNYGYDLRTNSYYERIWRHAELDIDMSIFEN